MFWSEVFENNPKIVRDPDEGQKVVVVENHPGNRPYIKKVSKERFEYNPNFFIEPGEIFLTEDEEKKCSPGCVIIEPHTKQQVSFSRNKAWPWERWQELVNRFKLPWVQLGPKGTAVLKNVQFIETPRFRETLGYINKASFIVTTDGALHHAAAALGRRAVVLWGGLASPDLLGYRSHVNIWMGDEACGSIQDCDHCKTAMGRITVDMVAREIQRLLDREKSTEPAP